MQLKLSRFVLGEQYSEQMTLLVRLNKRAVRRGR